MNVPQTPDEDRVAKRWIDPVIVGLMIIGIGGAIATWAKANETKAAVVRVEQKFDAKANDHEQRIRTNELTVATMRTDVQWIRRFLEDKAKAGSDGGQ